MKIEKSIKFLDFLLEPLGIQVHYPPKNHFIQYKSAKSCKFVSCVGNGECYSFYADVDNAFHTLFTMTMHFRFFTTNNIHDFIAINNPYLGCKSLDEAAIRRDLLVSENT